MLQPDAKGSGSASMGGDTSSASAQGTNGIKRTPIHANRKLRVIGIGAGASGVFLAYKMKHYFADFTLDIYEKNAEIGGTWYENRYPGCACDVPAHNYTYSFEPKYDWSGNYASSREIFTYFKDFVKKYDLGSYIKCNTKVVGAAWNDKTSEWTVSIEEKDGSVREQQCDFLINASGILNNWRWPAIPGLHDFKGDLLHSASWDDDVILKGKHVGLIGNGSSGIQILPQVQKTAGHVTTFIREATWISPPLGLEPRAYTEEDIASFQRDPESLRHMRKQTELSMSNAFALMLKGSKTNEEVTTHLKNSMVEKLAGHPITETVIPGFTLGCRRLTPGVGYLETYNMPNVTAFFGGIEKVNAKGCLTSDGKQHDLDVLICATGFDTTFKPRFPLLGVNGKDLAKEWAVEPTNYLSIAASGFPNYFMFLGPNCPIANGPIIFSIEIQCEYMCQFMNRWQKENILSFDPKQEAVDDFMYQKDLYMEKTVWTSSCQSWYKNPASGKITATWPGSTAHYLETMSVPRYDDYNVKYKGRRFDYLGMGFGQREFDPNADLAYYIRNGDDKTSLFKSSMSTFNAKDINAKMDVGQFSSPQEPDPVPW